MRTLTCADLWAAKYDGLERYRWSWANLAPTFGRLEPRDVTQALARDYVAARGAGRPHGRRGRPSTIRLELSCLIASWNAAVERRQLDVADVPAIRIPAASPPRDRWLTDTEIDALLAAAAEQGRLSRVERFCWIALDACARRTAIQELRWDTGQVDIEQRVLHLNPPGRRQTTKRRASVPISDRLLDVLRRAHDERVGPYVLDTPTNINGPLAAVASRAGLGGVHPHVLRHTAATHMARRGIPLWIIAQLLGNTLAQVESVYAKWQPDFGRDAVEAIGGRRLSEPGQRVE